ncbi:MAG: division/cell wall cluster transcriptional repressor MraZ [Actinobacteria bacterium]|nr:division/cell wall cluster transcriptional repressor MraZ [Actinomycetota bacterium]MBV8480047.1 division/cell wall cluster transcriptional repressor MraZ [Actinomycetota bacterium]
MLLGTHEHTIDDKNRLTLPARFRSTFASGVVVTRGLDPCLVAFPRDEWAASQSRIADLDTLSSEARALQRVVYANAVEGDLDKQGRMIISSRLKDYAGLTRDVVVAGVNDHLEIWDRAAWERELGQAEGRTSDVAERLAAKRD